MQAIAIVALCVVPLAMHFAVATGRAAVFVAALGMLQVAAVATLMLHRVFPRIGLATRLAVAGSLAAAGLLVALGQSVLWGIVADAAIDHALVYLGLLAVFAASLRPGRVDVVTALATRVKGTLLPEVARYTRRVTMAWCGFFAAELLMSLALYLFAPLSVWSLFVNVLDAPLVAGMFAAEYACRRVVLRRLPHPGILQAVRALRNHPPTPAPAATPAEAG